jgi:hypothetical protein
MVEGIMPQMSKRLKQLTRFANQIGLAGFEEIGRAARLDCLLHAVIV